MKKTCKTLTTITIVIIIFNLFVSSALSQSFTYGQVKGDAYGQACINVELTRQVVVLMFWYIYKVLFNNLDLKLNKSRKT